MAQRNRQRDIRYNRNIVLYNLGIFIFAIRVLLFTINNAVVLLFSVVIEKLLFSPAQSVQENEHEKLTHTFRFVKNDCPTQSVYKNENETGT